MLDSSIFVFGIMWPLIIPYIPKSFQDLETLISQGLPQIVSPKSSVALGDLNLTHSDATCDHPPLDRMWLPIYINWLSVVKVNPFVDRGDPFRPMSGTSKKLNKTTYTFLAYC